MADSESAWRSIINGLKIGDLPSDGSPAPEIEALPKIPEGAKDAQQQFFVQKLVTEVYVYTDLENHTYGSMTFQTDYLLGDMTAKKLQALLEKERKKRSK